MNSVRGQHQIQRNQWLAAIAASAAMFGADLDIVWYSDTNRISLQEQWLVEKALAFISVIIGAIVGAVMSDIFGRRRTLLVTSVFAIPRMAAPYLTTRLSILINMLVASFSSGITCAVVPLYISEIAGTDNRGNLMVVQLSVHSFGLLASRTVDSVFLSYGNCEEAGLVRGSLLAVSMLFHTVMLWGYPETPHYLNWKNGSGRDPAHLPVDSHLKNEEVAGWVPRLWEILRFENRRSLAFIFSLIMIRRASGHEGNLIVLMNMTTDLLPIVGFCAAKFIASVFVAFNIHVFGRKVYLLLTILGSFITVVISATTLTKYHWILSGVLSAQELCYLIFIAVTLAYVGELFPIQVRAVAIAAVISCEVVTRNVFFLIDKLLVGTGVRTAKYTPPLHPYFTCVTLFVSFFSVLIFFPKTKTTQFS